MSSGTRYEPRAGHNVSMTTASEVMERLERLGMTPRQQALNSLWGWYRCVSYEARRCDWNGQERMDPVDHEAIATAGFLPPGFYDAGQNLPLKFRKPTAPYALVKVIVDRFTGLLFSERRHPKFRFAGDPEAERFTEAVAEASRFWPSAIQARTYGGAMGTAVAGFQFVEGRPVVEIHDPRWVFPVFEDRFELKLQAIEKRYQFPVEMKDPETGRWLIVPHWYRRVIDKTSDVLFKPVPVDDEEPDWVEERRVDHNLGFCPVVWAQNLPVQDDVDGDSDCHGVYEMVEAIDTLLSQAQRGVTSNCDPTLVAITDAALSDLRKGSGNAIKLPAGSSAQYLEISGSGPLAARELAQEMRGHVLEVAQVVLEHPDIGSPTATEIERRYASMLSRADIFREQYGEKLLKPLMEMMLRAAAQLSVPRVEGDQVVRGELDLQVPIPRSFLKPGSRIKSELKWHPYFEPTYQDAIQAAQAAATAKTAGLIDDEHATEFIASLFRVEDVQAMLLKLQEQNERSRANFEAEAMRGMPPFAGTGEG